MSGELFGVAGECDGVVAVLEGVGEAGVCAAAGCAEEGDCLGHFWWMGGWMFDVENEVYK